MLHSKRLERRAEGKCEWALSCNDPVTKGGHCAKHNKARRANDRTYRMARYQEKKLAGICTTPGCESPADEDSLSCAQHREKRKIAGRGRNLAALAAASKALRDLRRQKKLCLSCGGRKPKRGRTKDRVDCDRCRERKNKRARDLRAAAGRVRLRCRNCLGPGHASDRCDQPPHPRRDEILGEEDRQRNLRYCERRAAKKGRALQIHVCSNCGRPRCRADSCTRRPVIVESAPPSSAEYAVARLNWGQA